MPTAKRGDSARDLAAVRDSPECTEKDFASERSFAEALPDLAKSVRKARGPNKAPTKRLVSIRLSREVIDHFKSQGPGWQSRIDQALRKAVKMAG